MKKMFVVVAAVAVVAMAIPYVFAGGPGSVQGYGPGSRWERPGDGPGYGRGASLTEEQRTQLQALRNKFHDETASLRQTVFTKRQELRSLWSDSNADPKLIVEKEREIRALQDQLRDKAVEHKLEARKIFTPEQLAQFGERRGRGFRSGRGPGRGSWGGCY